MQVIRGNGGTVNSACQSTLDRDTERDRQSDWTRSLAVRLFVCSAQAAGFACIFFAGAHWNAGDDAVGFPIALLGCALLGVNEKAVAP